MSIIIPSAESDRKKIKDAMTEISNSMTRIDAEKDFQKAAVEDLSDEVGIDKKYLKRLANTYHKQNLVEVTTEADDLQSLYETCLK
jgi:archaellum component FlaC